MRRARVSRFPAPEPACGRFRFNMTELRRQLEWIAGLNNEDEASRNIGIYERFVLKHGYEFSEVIELPTHVRRGENQMCFGNAALEAIAFPDEFIYTEGYAYIEGIPLTILHGWLTDRQGRVVDPTWGTDKKVDYYGVLVKHKYVRSRMGLSVIDDWRHGWPLLMSKDPTKHLVKLEKWISSSGPGA